MKRILYFDCSAGVSGDMTLGALIHLGVSPADLLAELRKLDVSGYEIIPDRGEMNGVTGVNLRVLLEESREEGSGHGHRSFKSIRDMIAASGLDEEAKRSAIGIFAVIAEAEAAVHGVPVDEVRFHEVGAVDSIIDIAGAAVCMSLLGIDELWCSPLHDGRGHVECRHGSIPVPVPAVVEMLKGTEYLLVSEDVPTEMVTPTGMGILKGMGARCGPMPPMRVLGAGYGFGKRDTGRFNALRVIMGEID
ncbi:MAG: LarC family nickel insertion protein [Clostridiales Family XIII bacterium]|nr:LarC family nickel insertion protein [Clostridiales Family XIII bacterium]